MNNKLVLVLGAVLIAVGVFKPDLSNLLPKGGTTVEVPAVEVAEPTDPDLLASALKVSEALKAGDDAKVDAPQLAALYADIAKLISLDGAEEVVRTTSEIREVNSVAGQMMNLKLKGDYPGLAVAARELVVKAVGDDVAVLNEETRGSAVAAFEALAWGCLEGAK